MPPPLVSTVPKYIDIDSKSLFSLDLIAKKWSKIALHFVLKMIAIVIGFIIADAVLKADLILSNIGKLTQVSKRNIEYCKFEQLNVIYKSGILSLIINVCN